MKFKACLFAKLDSISVKLHAHGFTGLHLSWDVSDLPVTHLPLFTLTVEAPPLEKDAYRGTRGHVCVPDSLDLCSTAKGSEICCSSFSLLCTLYWSTWTGILQGHTGTQTACRHTCTTCPGNDSPYLLHLPASITDWRAFSFKPHWFVARWWW